MSAAATREENPPACPPVNDAIEVRLARSAAEIDAAQKLRYQVFFREWGAQADAHALATERDRDRHDPAMDHLVVIDHRRSPREGQVVGNYRLLRCDRLGALDRFYTAQEFDIAPLLGSGRRLLELGRSCVLREYRGGTTLQLMWRAIAAYVAEHRIELMFGCASFRGTDPEAIREQLSYLHHHRLAPEEIRPRALAPHAISMDRMDKMLIDPSRAMAGMEPIIKGYLRAGATIGHGASVDRQFNSIDVCIVMPTERLASRYRRNFERRLQRPLASAPAPAVTMSEPRSLALQDS